MSQNTKEQTVSKNPECKKYKTQQPIKVISNELTHSLVDLHEDLQIHKKVSQDLFQFTLK